MKSLATLVTLICLATLALAQPPAMLSKGKITGIVLDSTNSKGVEFANVALLDPNTKSPINGNVCDDQGKFAITDVPLGKYIVSVSFLGYKTKAIPVQLTDKNSDLDLGNVQISPSAIVLKGVEVTAQKSLVEEKVDRLVYNAEADATAKGGDATDVLRRVPLLTVDLDGNVSLRGSSNLKVLINNKPSTITATSVSDALKQIPADQIKSVEVITSPSAKYDAEGSAGIINIITKKNTLEGLTLNINSSAGFRGSNLGLQGGYRKGKLGLTLGGFGRANYNTPGSFTNNQQTYTHDPNDNSIAGTYTNIQSASTRQQNIFGNYTLGLDYDINKSNSLTGSVRFGIRDGHSYQDNLSTLSYTNSAATHNLDSLTSATIKNISTLNTSHSVDASLNYTHLFAKQNREFNLLTLYSQSTGDNNVITNTISSSDPNAIIFLKNLNPTKNTEATLQADFQTPIGDNQLIEIGAKDIARQATSNGTYQQADASGVYQGYTGTLYRSNALDYSQNITAGYASYSLTTARKYSLKAGARYENTTVSATTSQGPFSTSYGVLVPSVNISKRLDDGSMLKASYNRRIQRPSIQNLNPNLVVSNPKSTSSGDPRLSPEYTNNYELSYNKFIKSTTINFSAFMRNTDNAITQVRDTRGDTVHTTYRNIGIQDAYGFSIFANVNLSNKLSLSGGSEAYMMSLKNPATSPTDAPYAGSNSGWVFNARMFGSYSIANGWGLQFFGFYRGRQVTLQGYQGAFRVYSLSLQKEFNEKRGSIGLGAENFATPSITIKSSSVSPILNQQSANLINYLNFKITFNYRIGKLSMSNPSRKSGKSINNDDLKDSGGGDDGGMGGGQQGGGGRGGMQGGGGQRPATQPNAKMAAADPTKEVNAAGIWNYTVESPQGGGGKLVIKKEGETYSGTITSSRNNKEVALKSVTVKGNEINIAYEVSFGGNTMSFTIVGTIKEDDLNGNMSVGQFGTFPINAKREK
ncbi:MAG TPA: TonB-dependent receptor [Cyclobacteriaceae bacterium]|nr:TonB-dependent receptor [Cyclobacteriaceae bacterium]